MSVRFFWCWTKLCPEFGLARRRATPISTCPTCGGDLHAASPDEPGQHDV